MSLKSVSIEKNRESTAEVIEGVCCNCEANTKVLVIDTSAGEYGSVAYCLECIVIEFRGK